MGPATQQEVTHSNKPRYALQLATSLSRMILPSLAIHWSLDCGGWMLHFWYVVSYTILQFFTIHAINNLSSQRHTMLNNQILNQPRYSTASALGTVSRYHSTAYYCQLVIKLHCLGEKTLQQEAHCEQSPIPHGYPLGNGSHSSQQQKGTDFQQTTMGETHPKLFIKHSWASVLEHKLCLHSCPQRSS